MAHFRLEGVLGLSQCLITDSGDCGTGDSPGLGAQAGLYYYMDRNWGLGLAASVAQWFGGVNFDSFGFAADSADITQVRVLLMGRATLPLHILELTGGVGLGFARKSVETYGIESFGVSTAVNARIGFFAYDGVLFGADATLNADLYEEGLVVSVQVGPYIEGIF